MDMQTLFDILNIKLIVSSLFFLIELGVVYFLYTQLSSKFLKKGLDKKRSDIRNYIFTAIFILIALYLFDFTGYPIAKLLVDTGILWFLTIIIALSLLYRITVVLEDRFK